MSVSDSLSRLLQVRKEAGLLRRLRNFPTDFIDFSSNDYLGFSFSGKLAEKTSELVQQSDARFSGSGGSRLLAGNSELAEELENEIASFHKSESALLFNSGYDANLGFFSSVPRRNDIVFYDELCHASIIDGIRLSNADSYRFHHNDLNDLRSKIQKIGNKGNIFIAVESLYSMDGDFAPLIDLADFSAENGYNLVVDEAHSTGVYGDKGNGLCCEQNIHHKVFARLFTYGKAMGTHGAAICGSNVLREYLVNYSRPFIFSTALPPHSLLAIKAAYSLLLDEKPRELLRSNISYYSSRFGHFPEARNFNSPVQALIINGNETVQALADHLNAHRLDVRAVKSPTVKAGEERLRISLHAHNTHEEINRLFLALSSGADFRR